MTAVSLNEASNHADPSALIARRFGVCTECTHRKEVRKLDQLQSGATLPSHCRLCGCRLYDGTAVDVAPHSIPNNVSGRIEPHTLSIAKVPTRVPESRAFTAADKALIRRMGAILPARDLLDLLNERLVADLGPNAVKYTERMLSDAIRELTPASTASINGWGGLRRILASARRSGLLDRITPQVIDDFAVVFSLSPAQAVRLRDTIVSAQESDAGGEQ